MFAETTAAIAAAKEAYALVKVLKEARDQSVIDSATGRLNEKITELQMLNAELASLYHAERQVTMKLTDENAKIEMFSAQAAEYEIYRTAASSVVYRSKSATNNEIGHYYLCAHCYQNRIISILQPSTDKLVKAGYFVHYCPACKNEFKMDKSQGISDEALRQASRKLA
ncbi:hypothetical protein [Yersinia aldovae]|uniref:hypothetical protein n=1 Tax=Yersinia aldovae TaxID=29483 RepID=UPI00119F1B9F|nr:hypothetical protein [Yersinia aldovae]